MIDVISGFYIYSIVSGKISKDVKVQSKAAEYQ